MGLSRGGGQAVDRRSGPAVGQREEQTDALGPAQGRRWVRNSGVWGGVRAPALEEVLLTVVVQATSHPGQ